MSSDFTAILVQGAPIVLIAAFLGYLLGSIPFGLLLTRVAGLGDIRNIGSGNIGATNVLRTGRKDIAIATLLLDGGKAALAAGLGFWLGPILAGIFGASDLDVAFATATAAGSFAFVGHCYPIWLGFNGGKGVATFFGLLLALDWRSGVLAALIWIAMAYVFRFSSLAALTAVAAAPIIALIVKAPEPLAPALVMISALIFWRHRDNIRRLAAGEESKIGAKKPVPDPDAPIES
ncbi:MAG: glycerol-3-phosphate 1-O-acyltransferase PlsY [Caulobacterales bacterium]